MVNSSLGLTLSNKIGNTLRRTEDLLNKKIEALFYQNENPK